MRDYIIIVGALGFAVASVIFMVAMITSDSNSDPSCYFVTDRTGREFPSYYPPTTDGTGVIYAFNDDHEWGYVFGPASMRVDRDCLRERGVDVPPLRKKEEAP